jgi:hypothetical protein
MLRVSADAFLLKRLCKAVQTHREEAATLPTLADLEKRGFPKNLVLLAVKEKMLIELYGNLTSGAVVKVYRLP